MEGNVFPAAIVPLTVKWELMLEPTPNEGQISFVPLVWGVASVLQFVLEEY